MLSYSNLLSRPNIEMNMIWELVINKARLKRNGSFFLNIVTVMMLIKERHGEHRKVDRKAYIFK